MNAAAILSELPPDTIETAFPTDDEDLFDFMYLTTDATGVDGVIFLSTRVGRHGPRVKWMPTSPGPGRPSCSYTLDDPARLVASSLPSRIINAVEPQIRAWISLNRDDLRGYWNEGAYWLEAQRDVFKASLKPVPR